MLFYILLLSIQVPANILYFVAAILFGIREHSGIWMKIYIILAIIYWTAVAALGIRIVIKSFHAYAKEDFASCLKGMLTLKYGLVPFFLVNFVSMVFLFLIALVGSRGTIIFAFPVVMAFIAFGSLCTWLAMLPGAFYGIQTIRLGRKRGIISSFASLLHGILQFIFLLDILDTIYLATAKFNAGKAASVLMGSLYAAGIVGIIFFVIKLIIK